MIPTTLFSPPRFDDPERTRVASLLHTILWSVIVVITLALIVALLFMGPANQRRIVAAISLISASVICLWATRLGRTRLASILLVVQFWLIITVLAISNGGTLAPSASGFVVTVIAAGLLLGSRTALAVAIISSLTELALAYLGTNGLLPPGTLLADAYAYWFTHSLVAALAVVLVHRAMHDELFQRRRAQDALKESEEQFRVMFESAAIGVALVDTNGRLVRSNAALSRLLGYSQQQLSEMEFAELTHPEDVLVDLELYRSLLAGERNHYEIEKRYIRKDGQTIWGQLTASIVKQQDGMIRFAIGMVEDITERKRGEQESRTLLYTLGERVKELTALHGAARILQQELDDVDTILHVIASLLPPAFQYPEATAARIRLGSHEATTAGFVESAPLLRADLTTSDGAKGSVEVICTRHPAAQEPFLAEEQALLNTLADMLRSAVDRRSASAALRESEGRFRELTEHIREVFWMVAADFSETLYISPAYESVWGRKREDVYFDPRSFAEAIHADDRERVRTTIERELARGFEVEYRIVRPDGDVRWIWDRGFPIEDATGHVYRVAGIAEDITERKKMEEQLRRTQRLESIGTLAGGIAHDLNNVLAPILLSVELLLRSVTETKARAMIERLATSAKRGREIVKQVLTFARGSEDDFAPQHLQFVVAEMECFVKEMFPRILELRVNVPHDLPYVMGNATQLHQILMNLCVNARDAMPKGGRLTIAASSVQIDEREARVYPGCRAGEYVTLSVSDNGAGMPAEIQEKIFEPFFTTKDVGKGTGLGLSTVYSIVRDHKGFIRLKSEIGKGTEFVIHLPALRPESSTSPPDAKAVIAGGHGETVLVIDDELSVLHIARETLESYGYRVLTAMDGAEAAALFAREPRGSIAMVITDVNMPLMDGFETAKALRRHDPTVRILITSGLLTDGYLDRLDELECQGNLAKPYTAEQLLTSIDEVLHPVV